MRCRGEPGFVRLVLGWALGGRGRERFAARTHDQAAADAYSRLKIVCVYGHDFRAAQAAYAVAGAFMGARAQRASLLFLAFPDAKRQACDLVQMHPVAQVT